MNIDRKAAIRKHDRERNKLPHRLAADRERKRNYYRNFPDRVKAKEAVRQALKKGELVRGSCERCGHDGSVSRIEGHHEDYSPSKWLDVKWLCRRCHYTRHVEIRKEQKCLTLTMN